MLLAKNQFTAFVCTESKLDSTRDDVCKYDIIPYSQVRHDREREGGGIVIYFNSFVRFSKFELNFSLPSDCEIHVYIMKVPFIKSIALISVYNSPSVKKSEFLTCFEKLLGQVKAL